MITIKKFQVSVDRKNIDVDIEVGEGFVVNDLKLWNEGTYKIITQAKDLNGKIAGVGNTESFTITLTDAGVLSFDGLYFLEIKTNDPSDAPGIVGTMSLTRYYGVITQLLANLDLSCLNCNDNFQNVLLLDAYVEAMKNGLRLGRFRDSINFLKKVNIFEEFQCAECSKINPTVSTAGNIVSIGVLDCFLAA